VVHLKNHEARQKTPKNVIFCKRNRIYIIIRERSIKKIILLPLCRETPMIYYLEKELGEILVKIKKEGISLQEGRDLYFEAKEKYLSFDEKARTQEESRLILKILFLVGGISEDFVKK